MKLSLGFSPCPNDTFIFDALIHNKIDTEGLSFEVILADVEELNRKAFAGELAITKLSYHAYAYLIDQYALLDAGSALGRNCGPLLIAQEALGPEAIESGPIAIPGKLTTANFLLSLAYPNATQKTEYLFSEIENAVIGGKAVAGLIIHENRFTYQEKGLVKIADLGEFWEQSTGFPIPLGGIVVNRDLPMEVQEKINRVLARSVQFAQEQPEQTLSYVKQHAQAMDPKVMFAHIDLYVNQFTLNLGELGRAAVRHLFQVATEKEVIPPYTKELFVR